MTKDNPTAKTPSSQIAPLVAPLPAMKSHSTIKKTASLETTVAAAIDLASGKGRRHVVATHGVSARDCEVLNRLSGASLAEFRAELVSRLQCLQKALAVEIQARLSDIPAGQLAVTFGILTDKLATMEGMPTQIHATANVSINGLSRAELTDLLSGKRQPRNVTPEA